MSLRRDAPDTGVHPLVAQLEEFKQKTMEQDFAPQDSVTAAPTTESAADKQPTFAELSETEKSAASLGVDPQALKPIGFMNTGHYENLLKGNAIDNSLARRLEAYKVVAGR